MKRLTMLAAFIVAALGLASFAAADTVGSITFNSPYVAGNINGQQDWMKTGAYDANVVSTTRYDFGNALQISSAITSGSFGDQTFSPGLANPAGESPALTHFDASFQIGTTQDAPQTGLHLSVSPDNGSGGRMSYLRFEDQPNGIHVFFDDVTNSGPYYTQAMFNETDIATLSRTSAHTIRFQINFKTGPAGGPGNTDDDVKIFIDGKKMASGTTWEDYYRYDNEKQGSGVTPPLVSKMLFLERGDSAGTVGQGGFLIDNLRLASS